MRVVSSVRENGRRMKGGMVSVSVLLRNVVTLVCTGGDGREVALLIAIVMKTMRRIVIYSNLLHILFLKLRSNDDNDKL